MFDIKSYFNGVKDSLDKLDFDLLNRIVSELIRAYQNGNYIYVFGNGGSASTASHFVTDLLKGVSYKKDKRFKIICFNDNIPVITAYSNDVSYDEIFVEQLKNFLKPQDIVIGITGSGNSENVLNALRFARKEEAMTIALTGFKGGKAKDVAEIALVVPNDRMESIEDVHMIIIHALKLRLIDILSK